MGAWQVGSPQTLDTNFLLRLARGDPGRSLEGGGQVRRHFSGFQLRSAYSHPWTCLVSSPWHAGGGTALPWQGEQLLGQALKK